MTRNAAETKLISTSRKLKPRGDLKDTVPFYSKTPRVTPVEDCFSGWDKGIKAGKEKFGRLSRYREDSSSVIVAPGCIFVGYDESDEDDDNKRTIASAIGRRDWVYKDFKVDIT